MSRLSSPTLGVQNIVMGLIKNGYHKGGTSVGIKVRKNVRKAEVSSEGWPNLRLRQTPLLSLVWPHIS